MICFDVKLNGARVCRAGVRGPGVLHACAGWVDRGRTLARPAGRRKASLSLDVGGMLAHGAEDFEHLTWPGRRLRSGDEVSIRVVEAASADRASSRRRDRPIPRVKLVLGMLADSGRMLGGVRGQRAKRLGADIRALLRRHGTRQP